MSRREYDVNNIQPIFFAPLTTDGRDIIGGLLPSSDSSAVTYSTNGVRITSSPRINFQYLISNELAKSTKCIYVEYFNLGSTGSYQYVIHLGYRPTSSSYNGGYRMMYCFQYNSNGLLNYSRSDNRFDDGDISINFVNTPNAWHKLAIQITSKKLTVVIDGAICYEKSIVDNWDNWDDQHQPLLALGSRIYNSTYPNLNRSLNGYIRNVKMFGHEFNDDELKNITL